MNLHREEEPPKRSFFIWNERAVPPVPVSGQGFWKNKGGFHWKPPMNAIVPV
jgi:hypothetical protein